MDVEADEEEEEEHPAPTDSVVVAPTASDQAPSTEETEPFEMDESAATPPPHLAYRTTARISIPAPVPMPAWTDSEVVRLLAISSPPASPLSPWSSPPPQIPFPPLPPILSPPSPILVPAPPPSPIRSLGYRAAMIRLRDEAASTSPPPPQLLSASRGEDRPEVTLPPRKRLDIALGPRYEVGESSSAATARPAGGFRADYGFVATVDREIMRDPEREVGYGITNSWDEVVETLQGAPDGTDTELGGYGRMPTKIELTLEQSQQGVSYDVLVSIEGVEELKRNVWIKGENKAALQTLLGRNQPLRTDASPTALSPGYVVDSDPEEDEEDPKEDPADRGDNDDDKSSNDDDDDDDVEKDEEDEEEEEHLALADPSDVSTDDSVLSSWEYRGI
uniref:Uncharacterized protein n=1 Tax=Tanacetum cinerariifolium TaxID=118510 RepID=A0A699IXT4_TANCI|nr:hypothetical protein [Tanacetum cinerariifolium]